MFFNSKSIEPIAYKSTANPNGPKIVLTCLNHGDEVIGLNSALELIEFCKKNEENYVGEIIIFPCLNEGGFWRGSRYFEAQNLDGNVIPNLNRVWPGGTNNFAALVAKKVFDLILSFKPDLVLDLHSYAQKSLIHTIVDRPGGKMEEDLIKISKDSNIPFYLEYPAETMEEQMLDKSLSNQLCLHNIPALTIELGPKGSFTQIQSQNAIEALVNILISTENFINTKTLNFYQKQNTEINPQKTYFRQGIYTNGESFGFYTLKVNIGELVQKGEEIIEVKDLTGKILEIIKMPETGFIIAMEDEAIVYPKRQIGVFIKEG